LEFSALAVLWGALVAEGAAVSAGVVAVALAVSDGAAVASAVVVLGSGGALATPPQAAINGTSSPINVRMAQKRRPCHDLVFTKSLLKIS
jgi:hypothetical protein